jgi:serine/threonine protein kinase/outer membrane biosynthesis protein TonB
VAVLHEHIEGKYEILGKLREGGMGAVYKVRHRLLDEVRVVKVLHPRLTVTPELNDRFLREARLAIQLRHPNIAQLHDFSVAEDGTAFIVMEFIDGVTLEGILLRTGPPPLGLGLEIGRQSLRALGFLHRRGLLHRDISPDNLMLTRDPDGGPLVKLIDLGIAKVLKGDVGGLTSTGLFLGKPRYASPEQFGAEGTQGVDSRSDLYSFGVVLYELLTGTCPIRGRDPSSLMAGHLFRPPVDFAESDPQGRLPSDLREILLRALAKGPDERFATAEDFARSLAEVQSRFPAAPAELDAVLASVDDPLEETVRPGSTQDKLDRHFVGPTPAPTVRAANERLPDATLVLAAMPSMPAPAKTIAAAPAIQEPAPPPVPPPAPPLPFAPRAQPEARVETRQAEERRSVIPKAAALLLLLALAGFGFWWLSRPEVAPTEAAEESPAPLAPAPTPSSLAAPAAIVAEAGPAPIPAAPAPTPTPAPEAAPPEASPIPAPTPKPRRETNLEPKVEPKPEPRPAKPAPPGRPAPRPTPENPPPVAKQPPASHAVPATTLGSKDLVVDDSDVPVQLLSTPPPSFPEAARGTGTYARIIIAVLVDANGAVSDAKVKNAYVEEGSDVAPAAAGPSLVTAFREAALAAARKARFEPASKDGEKVKSWGELKFEFGKKPGG